MTSIDTTTTPPSATAAEAAPSASAFTWAIRKYRWKYAGMLGFWIQRLTGIGLLVYLFLHVHTIHLLSDPDPKVFHQALEQFRAPLFKLGEILLLGAVILHALNGIRITMADMGVGLTKQRAVFWWFAVGVGLVVFLAGAIPIFIYTVLGHANP